MPRFTRLSGWNSCVVVKVVVVWLDRKQTQHARTAFDVHSSLISIEATDASPNTLASVARRIQRQVRGLDSIVLLPETCALLFAAMPFSGAQSVARQIAPLLHGASCKLHVYHGMTALLFLQRLQEAGARMLTDDDDTEDEPNAPAASLEQEYPLTFQEMAAPLPYLAFLTDYPSPRLLHLFPYELACHYHCVPVGSERKMLTLATCHWLNREVVTQLLAATRCGIFQVRCEISIIDEVLRYWQRSREPGAPSAHRSFETSANELCSSVR